MIISASRRTDIPAFFAPWFFNRIDEGFVLVRNPMNPKMVSRISLSPDIVDCIVFWTKNPRPILDYLSRLDNFGYHYYFLFSLNGYGPLLEEKVPPVDLVIDTFCALSGKIGKERVIWRYDPIVLTDEMDAIYHLRHFRTLAEQLSGATETCIFSFLDLYQKCRRNLSGIDIVNPDLDLIRDLSLQLNDIASGYGINLSACAEDLTRPGLEGRIRPAQCIDDRLVGRISGREVSLPKDKNQRALCGCVESIDIGAYNTCGHLCKYCYANSNPVTVKNNVKRHFSCAPFLVGQSEEGDVVRDRSLCSGQVKFLANN